MFGKKDNDNSDQNPSGGTYTVEDTFRLNNSQDLIVVGQINGTVRTGDKVCIEGTSGNAQILIKELDIFRTKVRIATNTKVALCLENGTQYGISKGTVLHVDDIGTIHCLFDNGRQLGLVAGEDYFHKIAPKDRGDAR